MNDPKNLDDLKAKLKMKIIISGNKIEKQILNIILKNNKSPFCSIDINNDNEFKMSIFSEYNWDIYELEEGFSEKICEKIYKIIHNNFGIKDREKESVLIFFTEEDNNDISILNFFDEKNSYFHPFILFITSNIKKDKLYYQKYIRENEIDFDERNIEVFQKNNKNIQELIFKKLWKICCYYNEIGDNIIIPELEIIEKQSDINVKYINYLNFFITGKPGAGKSTLINVICNEKKAKEKIGGGSVTTNIVKYYVGDSPIALYDTPGFNSRKDIEDLIKNIGKKMDEIYELKEQIHGIFYVIDSKSTRTLDEGEILLIKFILESQIPLFFLLNFSKYKMNKRNHFLDSLLEILEKEYPKTEITKNIYLINLKNDYNGNIIFGLDKLFQDLYNFYYPYKIDLDDNNKYFNDDNLKNVNNDEIIQTFNKSFLFKNIKRSEDILKICKDKSISLINKFTFFSFLGGFIPYTAVGISGMQVFLLTSILSIYGFSPNNIEKKDAFKNAGILSMSAISNYFVDSLCNAFLLFPIIGYVVSTFIKGGVAIGTTYYAGRKCIDFCEKNFESKNIISFYKKFAYNYNKAIENLSKISEDFKRLNKN
jgi:GTP-binding protein EngB required for normal cell division